MISLSDGDFSGSRLKGGIPSRMIDGTARLVLLVAAFALRQPGLAPSHLWPDDAWIAVVHRIDDPTTVAAMGLTAPGFALVFGVGSTSSASARRRLRHCPFSSVC